MKFKKIMALTIGATLMLSLFGCGTKSTSTDKETTKAPAPVSKTIKVAFNGDGANKEATQKIFDMFKEKNPNIKVEVTYIPTAAGSGWNDYFTKIQTMVAGGSAPDVTFVAIEGIQNFKKLGLAHPIDEYIKKYPNIVGDALTDINPKLQKPFTIDGKNYGFVTEWNNMVVHLNTKLLKDAGLQAPPENWSKDDFLKYCEKLTKTVDGKKQYALAIPNYYFGAEAWLYNNNASILNDDMTKSTLNQPNAVEVFQLWQDLIYKFKYAPFPEPNTDPIQQLMTGQIAMMTAGRWPVQNYTDNKFTDVTVQYIPTLKSNTVIFGSGAFCVLNSSKNKEEAAQVAMWTASPEFLTAYLGKASIPTRKSVADAVVTKVGVPQNSELFYKTSDSARAVQSPIQYPAVATVFDKYLSAVLSNQMKAQDAMDKATVEIDAILAKK